MAHCDILTEQIYGCEPGSYLWYHEQGHIVYSKTELSGQLQVIQQIIGWVWMFTITLSILNKYMFVIALPSFIGHIGIDIYEERWCNKYAKLNCKRGERGKKSFNKSKS